MKKILALGIMVLILTVSLVINTQGVDAIGKEKTCTYWILPSAGVFGHYETGPCDLISTELLYSRR